MLKTGHVGCHPKQFAGGAKASLGSYTCISIHVFKLRLTTHGGMRKEIPILYNTMYLNVESLHLCTRMTYEVRAMTVVKYTLRWRMRIMWTWSTHEIRIRFSIHCQPAILGEQAHAWYKNVGKYLSFGEICVSMRKVWMSGRKDYRETNVDA